MKGSLVLVGVFALGVLAGRFGWLPAAWAEGDASLWALYLLMFLVGLGVGGDASALGALRQYGWKVFWLPLGTVLGTYAGVLLAWPLSGLGLADCLAVGSGFGYYSLSSVFIDRYRGAELGTVALVCNILREIITLLGAPLLVRWFSPLAPIAAGGATTMDTTLPVIARFSGKEWVIVSIFHGFCVDLSVPFLVTFFALL